MTRAEAVQHAIAFDASLETLGRQLARFEWDAPAPLQVLTATHIVAVLDRFLRGSLSAEEVGGWAELLENREDIGFEPETENVVWDAIWCLANPDINAPRGLLDTDFALALRERLETNVV
jgi:hypothetical protein